MSVEVFFDEQIFMEQRRGGISRYFVELVGGLQALGAPVRILAPLHRNDHIAEARLGGFRVSSTVEELRGAPATIRAIARAASTVLRELTVGPETVIHETYYRRDDRFRRQPTVVTVHDMIPEQLGGTTGVVAAKRRAVKAASQVVCVSEATRRALLERVPIPETRVHVVHHGLTALPAKPARAGRGLPDAPYLLYVGKRRGYKNFQLLARASAELDIPIVCFGGEAPTSAERADLSLVHWMRGDDQALAAAYDSARATVVTSRIEGFGLPVLESLGRGTPVVCADVPVLREVAGDDGRFFVDDDSESLRAAIRALDEDTPATRQARRRRTGARFSWERCARETLAVYRLALEKDT